MTDMDWDRTVAKRIPISRRREKLTWAQRAAVALLPENEQEYWMDRAENENLSAQELTMLIAKEQDGTTGF